ncbi:hypothetical protein R5R35_012190 [Gryllus longicercus]|uniref:PEHE domain-containing protein n=1 Tax=Gryllus longicercus TaxID=2509291 RepID=A0AAN9VZD9_9ORTH
MGIKFASLRHPDVVVMAPALTEAGQSQNFKLPPSAHSSPGSPVSVAFNGVKKLAVPHLLSDANLCKNRTKKFCGSEKLICQRVNGFQKLEDTRFLDPNFDAFENLTTLAIASELTKGTGEDLCAGRQKHPGEKSKGHSKEGKFIMNQCDPSMGDHQDNMGFQKPNNAVPNTECANLMKDKTLSNDMDQLLKNLGAAISGNELSSGTDLGQNVEDILQVINNMETNPPETDSMNTDNMGLGNMDPTENVEAESMFQMADGADLSTLERELLNVDMMNMCVDVNINDNTLELENKEALSAVRLEDVRKKQFELERKCEFLGRRLRKLHARSLGKHASGEVTGVLEQAYRMLQSASGKEGENSTENSDSQIVQTSGSVVVKVEPNVKEKRVKGISSSSLANLFRRLDVISQQQAAITSRQQVPHKYFGAGSGDHSTVAVSNNGISAFPKFLSETKEEVEQVSGQLHTQVEVVEHAFDSDATASSSGGESCDEMQNFNNPHQVSVSIGKRAAWRWARDRAGVASRWTWLQAQISDLEYRIRQHNEIHRQIRAAKGHVCLGEAPAGAAVAPGSGAPPPSPAPAPASAPASAPAPGGVGGGRASGPHPNHHHLHHHHHHHALVVNGFHGSLPGGAKTSTNASPAATAAPSTPAPAPTPPGPAPAPTDSCGSVGVCGGLDAGGAGCSRTRPLVRGVFRKRKLLQVAGLHVVSKKAARAVTVRCGCQPPLSWCALCTGRADPTAPLPQPDLLTPAERVALLDPCFHPVLSFPEDVPQHIHYEAIMRTSDWQQKTLRSNLKALKSSGSVKTEKDVSHERRHKKPQVEHRRKYTSRLKKTAANTLTAKIKRKLSKGRKTKSHDPNNHSLQRLKRKRSLVKGNMGSYHQFREDGEDDTGMDSAMGSKYTSPVPSPCSAGGMSTVSDRLANFSQGKERGDGSRRKRENSYDIDNIVIPYSIAASTRLEKLQYKEIPTPKWRIVERSFESPIKLDLKNNGVVRRSSQESDVEDMCEDTIALRHDRCEIEERKKFMSYIKLPYSGRGRTRRTDSRAESSGANTPDPLSPNNMLDLPGEGGGSPMTSPPATPLSSHQDMELPPRRRTISQSRWIREKEEIRSITPDHVTEVPPFDPRSFPLSDETYDKMLKSMPEGHPFPPVMMEPKKITKALEMGEVSQPASPGTDSTESALGEGEDPNDPEWTVEEEKEFERDRMKMAVKR